MNDNTVGRWITRAFKETPWTAWLIAINLVVWLLHYFGVTGPAEILTGEVGVKTAWRWLTYPLYTPLSIIWLAVILYIFHWIGSSLERMWGSEKFGRVFVVVTLLTAVAYWLGSAATQQTLNPTLSLESLTLPEAAFFVIWAALHAEATVMAFMIIPIKAKYFALASVVLTFFSFAGNPVFGLFAIAVPVAGWFWAKRSLSYRPAAPRKSFGERVEAHKRARKKASFTLVEGQGKGTLKKGLRTQVPDLRDLNREVEAREKTANEAEMDRILDKIRFEGMASLSAEEKETLDRQSRKLKDR